MLKSCTFVQLLVNPEYEMNIVCSLWFMRTIQAAAESFLYLTENANLPGGTTCLDLYSRIVTNIYEMLNKGLLRRSGMQYCSLGKHNPSL